LACERPGSANVAPAVIRRHALASELGPLPVPRLASVATNLQAAEADRLDPSLEDPGGRLRVLLDEVALERHQDRALLLGREPLGELEPAAALFLEHGYSGMLPCLRAGTDSRFVESIRRARTSRG